MGAKMVVSFANIFMAAVETAAIISRSLGKYILMMAFLDGT